ncbi:hypothetical protein [Isoptericola sp. NPDC057653]|uniref:hypothetical protein n=1 Tax=Isoptericola sp. NPDC057653 TaxID=3346195 RepID=UPI0036841E76
MASVPALVPAEHMADHVLVLPRPGASAPDLLLGLAAAWFDDVAWLRPPADDAPTRGGGGARFHGARVRGRPTPALLRLGDEHRAAGPFLLDDGTAAPLGVVGPASAWALGRVDGGLDQRAGRPVVHDDRDGLVRAFAAGLPAGEELRVVTWAVAAARRTGGVLLADGRQALRPDPAASVDLSVWPARPVPAAELLEVVRSVVATSDLGMLPGGVPGHRVVARTPYDGDLVVDQAPAGGLPRALAHEPWPDGAPATMLRLAWLPQDPYELEVEVPSGVHGIARSRARALLARIAALLQARAGGAVLDDAGFALRAADLSARRESPTPGTRAWV